MAHLLKYEYGMNPILVTWPPAIYTDIGYNFNRGLRRGLLTTHIIRIGESIAFLPSRHTSISVIRFSHSFGQEPSTKNVGSSDIPLVIFGENEASMGMLSLITKANP